MYRRWPLGLGLQGTSTKDCHQCLIIIFERPTKWVISYEMRRTPGQTVQTESACAATEVVTLDRIAIIVPTPNFLESAGGELSHGKHPHRRLILPVGVAYESDWPEVREWLIPGLA